MKCVAVIRYYHLELPKVINLQKLFFFFFSRFWFSSPSPNPLGGEHSSLYTYTRLFFYVFGYWKRILDKLLSKRIPGHRKFMKLLQGWPLRMAIGGKRSLDKSIFSEISFLWYKDLMENIQLNPAKTDLRVTKIHLWRI